MEDEIKASGIFSRQKTGSELMEKKIKQKCYWETLKRNVEKIKFGKKEVINTHFTSKNFWRKSIFENISRIEK